MGSAVESSGMACSMAMLWGSTFWSDLLLLLGSSMQSFTSTDEKGTSLGRWTSNWSSNSSTKNYYQLLQIEAHLLILILNNINIYISTTLLPTKKNTSSTTARLFAKFHGVVKERLNQQRVANPLDQSAHEPVKATSSWDSTIWDDFQVLFFLEIQLFHRHEKTWNEPTKNHGWNTTPCVACFTMLPATPSSSLPMVFVPSLTTRRHLEQHRGRGGQHHASCYGLKNESRLTKKEHLP